MTDTTASSGSTQPRSDSDAQNRTREQVDDALELARFVVATGVTDELGDGLPFSNIAVIETTAALLGILDVRPDAGATTSSPTPITTKQWNAFEQAYYNLAIATSPVTAETLRNTRNIAGASGAAEQSAFTWFGLWKRIRGYSPAQTFTRWLWLITGLVVLLVMVTEWRIDALGMNPNVDKVKVSKDLWEWVQPWAYGALGSCAYLLRQGHYYIRERSFDLRRKPEYFNRILLGAISGGAIILFIDYLVSQDDTFSHLGATALGFLAGYSTDFLFNTIERIIKVIFPKLQVETVVEDSRPKRPAKPSSANNANNSARSSAGDQQGSNENENSPPG